MSDFERAFAYVHRWECGPQAERWQCPVANLAGDSGGKTLHGIAINYHPDAWADGPPGPQPTLAFYRKKFWDPAHCDEFPWPLNLVVFDWSIHAGEDNPARVLHILTGGSTRDMDDDIGPEDVKAVQDWMARLAAREALHARKIELLGRTLAKRFPGWQNRMAELKQIVGDT